MPKVIINDSQGLKQVSGSGLEIDSSIVASGLLTLSNGLVGSVDTRAEAGAVSLTSLVTLVTTTNSRAITLAAGATGQIKVIVMTVDGGDATLTPAGGILGGSTTITFADVGDAVVLVYTGAKWAIVSNEGCTVA